MGRNRFVFPRFAAALWAFFGSAGGCTTPTFDPPDAALLDADSDAGNAAGDADASALTAQCLRWQGPSALPPGAEALVGHYAARLDAFGFDDIATIHAREHEHQILAVELLLRNGGLEMDVRTCDWHSSYDSLGTLLTATRAPLDITSLPDRTLRLAFGPGCSWSAHALPGPGWGYAAMSPATCVAGGSSPRSAQQAWLTDTCACALDDGALPRSDADCRVEDPDGDRQPGVTIVWQNDEVGGEVYYEVVHDQSELGEGVIGADGLLTAVQVRNLAVSHLGGDFPRSPVPCPDSTSRATLKPVPASAAGDACTDALRAFWQDAEPTFPERDCPSQ